MGVDRQKILQYMEEREWSQAELARRMGVQQQTISKWLKGEVSINEARLQQMARVFGIHASELLADEGMLLDPYWRKAGELLSPEARRKFAEFIRHLIESEPETRTIQGLLPEGKEDSGQEPSRPNDKAVVRRDKADLAARLSSLGRTLTLV